MTINQLKLLTEDELSLLLVIVNLIFPPQIPKMEFEPRHLTWFKHDMLIKKVLDAFPKLNPEGHAIYASLLEKLGVSIEIRKNIIPSLIIPDANSIENTSINPVTGSTQSNIDSTGSAEPNGGAI